MTIRQASWDTAILAQRLADLTQVLESNQFSTYLRTTQIFRNEFRHLLNLPIMRSGLTEIRRMGTVMQDLAAVQTRSLATNKNLLTTIGTDQIAASIKLGVQLTDVAQGMIALREAGFNSLDKSVVTLIARFKATGQDVGSLAKIMSTNTTVLMMTQKQSGDFAVNLANYAKAFGTRQDEILNLAAAMSKNFSVQAQLGAGEGLTGGFTTLGAQLGGKGIELANQAAAFFSKATLSQLQLLGIAQGFQERLAMESDPARQAEITKQLVITAARTLNSFKGGLGTDAASSKIFEQLLGNFGGQGALAFTQLAKALQESNKPIFDLSDSITGFNSVANAFIAPFQVLGTALTALLNTPFVGGAVKWVSMFVGTLASIASVVTIYRTVAILFSSSAEIFRISVGRLQATLLANAAVVGLNPGGGVIGLLARSLPILGAIVGIGGLVAGIYSMKSDISELNRKTPDNSERIRSNNLNGQIFSQLVNIVTSQNRESVQLDTLATQKELLRLAKAEFDRNSPNAQLVSIPARGVR